jgi:hypothetical protein
VCATLERDSGGHEVQLVVTLSYTIADVAGALTSELGHRTAYPPVDRNVNNLPPAVDNCCRWEEAAVDRFGEQPRWGATFDVDNYHDDVDTRERKYRCVIHKMR